MGKFSKKPKTPDYEAIRKEEEAAAKKKALSLMNEEEAKRQRLRAAEGTAQEDTLSRKTLLGA